MSFGKVSQPIVTSSGTPFLSGVGPDGPERGRSRAAAPVVFSSPIAAWQPVAGATKYQIEMSRTIYPWHAAKTFGTPATSIVLAADHPRCRHVVLPRSRDQPEPAGGRARTGLVDAGRGQGHRQP